MLGKVGKLGDLLIRVVTLAQDIQRNESEIKEIRQDIKKMAETLADCKHAINNLKEKNQELENLKQTVTELNSHLDKVKGAHEKDRELFLTKVKLLFSELENGLKDKEGEINARIETRFSKLEASQRNDIEVSLAKLEYPPPSSKSKRQRLIKGKHNE